MHWTNISVKQIISVCSAQNAQLSLFTYLPDLLLCVFRPSNCIAVMWQSAALWLLLGLWSGSHGQSSEPMFKDITGTVLPADSLNNPTQLNYGMAVTDVDGDGDLEVVVAG